MSRENDIRVLSSLPPDKFAEYVLMQLRNLWAVDGLYFLGIEDEYGTQKAAEIDENVWEVMGKIEARKLKTFLGSTGTDIASMMAALRLTSWALDLEDKEIIIKKNRAVIRNTKCRVQNTRLEKGLPEFGCKPVRLGFLKAFAAEFNKNISVTCNVCPPDPHTKNLWCEWEFRLEKE